MANRKITDLAELTTPASDDVIPIVDISETGNATKNKKITAGNLLQGTPSLSFKLANGTEAAPSLAFTSATSTGLYRSAANELSIATNGGQAIKVESNNKTTIYGDLVVTGGTTTISSTQIDVNDKNLQLATGNSSDSGADGGGLTVKGASDKTWNWVDSTDAWTANQHIDVTAGKVFKIAGTEVLNATTLGSGVVSSSLTSVGTLGSLTVTNAITAGSLDISGGADIDGDITVSSAQPKIYLTDTNNDSDYLIKNGNGEFNIQDVTNSANRLTINSSGNATFSGSVTATGGLNGSGASITALNASNISQGVLAAARVATLNQDTTGTAAIATTVTVADESGDVENFILFTQTATGNLSVKSGTNLTFNSNTGYLSATGFSGNGSNLTSLHGSEITSGTLPDARFPSTLPAISGANLTNVNATTLDSIDSGSFLRSDADDTMSAQLTLTDSGGYPLNINGSANGKILLQGATNPYIRWREGSTDKAFIQWHSAGYFDLKNQEDGSVLRIKDAITFSLDGTTFHAVWHGGNDGSGSGLDADLLDGQEGSYYRNASNLNAGTVSTARLGSGTASSSVYLRGDGTWAAVSAGDATTIDGLDSTQFLRSDQDDTTTGRLTLNPSADEKIVLSGSSDPYIRFKEGTNSKAYIQWNSAGYIEIVNQGDNSRIKLQDNLVFTNDGWSSTYKIWNESNDGSGSGLDADKWDSHEFASYLNQAVRTDSDVTHAKIHASNWFRNDSAGEGLYNTITGCHFHSAGTKYWHLDSNSSVSNGGLILYSGYNSSEGSGTGRKGYIYWDSSGFGLLSNDGTWAYRHNNTNADIYGTLRRDASHTIWDAGNDGSGSGLDADTVDGIQAASFLRADTSDTVNGGPWQLTNSNSNWAYRFFNSTGTNNSVYMAHGSGYGMHIRSDTSTTDKYLLQVYGSNGTDFMVRGGDAKVTSGGNTMWHAGNDGSGSGLDADSVDGIAGSSFLRSDAADTFSGDLTSSGSARLLIKKTDNNASDHIIFYNGTTRIGEIGCEDTTWLRINQETAKNIYTPRYIRADGGFFVDGSSKGINGSGNFTGGTIAGASDYSTLLRSNASDTCSGDITFTGGAGAVTITSSDIRSNGSSDWTGNPGASTLKIQAHSNRWYIVSNGNSNRICQFRVNGTDRTWIANDGQIYHGSAGSTDKYWRQGNDGASSGLDADTCDGQHLSTTSNVTFMSLTALSIIANAAVFLGDDKNIKFGNTESSPEATIRWDTSGFFGADFTITSIFNLYYNSGANGVHNFNVGGTGRLNISSTYINCYEPLRPYPHNNLDVGTSSRKWDDVYATNGTIQTSDRNEKNTIVDTDLGLSFINKLKPVSYKFNNKTRTHYGLIAQDVETTLSDISKPTTGFAGFIKEEIPDQLYENEDQSAGLIPEGKNIGDVRQAAFTSYGLRYNEFIAPLIKAVQELSAEVETLKTKVSTLESA